MSLDYDVFKSEKYRDNPENVYHDEYQGFLNRFFGFVIICLFFAASCFTFGILNSIFWPIWLAGVIILGGIILIVVFMMVYQTYLYIRYGRFEDF